MAPSLKAVMGRGSTGRGRPCSGEKRGKGKQIPKENGGVGTKKTDGGKKLGKGAVKKSLQREEKGCVEAGSQRAKRAHELSQGQDWGGTKVPSNLLIGEKKDKAGRERIKNRKGTRKRAGGT